MEKEDKYNLNLLVGPAGVGKRTIIRKLKEHLRFQEIIPISTNPFFSQGKNLLNQDSFIELIEKKSFCLSFSKNGNYYGVLKKQLAEAISNELPVIWKISSEGAKKIKTSYPFAKIIYVTAPLKDLRERLLGMGIKSDDAINERLIKARSLMEKASSCADYILVNNQGEIDKTIQDLINIIQK